MRCMEFHPEAFGIGPKAEAHIDSRDAPSFRQPLPCAWLIHCLQAYVFLWRSLMPKLPFFCAMEDQVKMSLPVVLGAHQKPWNSVFRRRLNSMEDNSWQKDAVWKRENVFDRHWRWLPFLKDGLHITPPWWVFLCARQIRMLLGAIGTRPTDAKCCSLSPHIFWAWRARYIRHVSKFSQFETCSQPSPLTIFQYFVFAEKKRLKRTSNPFFFHQNQTSHRDAKYEKRDVCDRRWKMITLSQGWPPRLSVCSRCYTVGITSQPRQDNMRFVGSKPYARKGTTPEATQARGHVKQQMAIIGPQLPICVGATAETPRLVPKYGIELPHHHKFSRPLALILASPRLCETRHLHHRSPGLCE